MNLSETYNLKVFYPVIAKQWHPLKNGDLTPDKVTPRSGKKVWWKCDKGHEWQAIIGNRTAGSNCPYCSGTRVSEEYNFAIIRPELARQWHPTKNGNLTPDKIAPRSKKKVWLKCANRHEWQTSLNNVYKYKDSTLCPFCVGKQVSRDNNLLAVNPELAKQWHPFKNGNLTPDKVMGSTRRKVWWICAKGHEWKARTSNRSAGIGCPKCSSVTATKKHNLMISHPDISSQWHPMKNGNLTPGDVTSRSIKKVWWMCDKGHEWEDIIIARTKYGNACPYCYGIDGCKEYNLLALRPDIARQWHPTKNGKLTPEDVTPGSSKKIWWVCDKGHEWRVTISGRCIGWNCPYCSGRYPTVDYNLQVTDPQLASQWHPIKNKWLKPTMVTPASRKKVWWKCDKDHEWQAVIGNRKTGAGCPYCSHKRASSEYNLVTVNPDIARQWHPTKNRDLTPDKVTPGSKKKVWWKCDNGHEWQAKVYNRSRSSKCPYCAGRKR